LSLKAVRRAGQLLDAIQRMLDKIDRALAPEPTWEWTPRMTPQMAAFIAEVERDGPIWEPPGS
jgi:hypothetical protein